jgi:hypothetical protein
MKLSRKLLLAALLILADASGEASADNGANSIDPNAVLVPYVWANCEGPAPSPFLCRSFVPGNETYVLYIRGLSAAAVAYRYTVTGTRADGVVLKVDAATLRRDVGGVTTVDISFGAPVSNTTVTVVELMAGSAL